MSEEAPKMAVRTIGSGPDVVLFHGGMGCWKHWIRNVDALAARFTVHALDHPSYGASASVPRETTGAEYLELFDRLFADRFPGDEPLRFAGFSFGGAIAAPRPAPRAARPTCAWSRRPDSHARWRTATRSYREAETTTRGSERFAAITLINMLSDPASVTEETSTSRRTARNTRFNSRGQRRWDAARRPAHLPAGPRAWATATTPRSGPPIS